MSGQRAREGRDDALGDALRRVRALERTAPDASGWPTFYQVPLFTWPTGEDTTNFSTVTLDSACAHNARRVANGTIGAYFVTHLRLGPYGSIWSVSVRHTVGPDHGILKFLWGTADEDAPVGGALAFQGEDHRGLMQGSDVDDPSVSYVEHALGIDGYNAAPGKNVLSTSYSEFRILGAPGAVLTEFASPSDPEATWGADADGGPGLWNLKLILDEKHASSSAYAFGISELRVQRIDWLGF